MDNTFQKIPFLRLTLAFASGVIFSSLFEFATVIWLAFAVLASIVLISINKWYGFKTEASFGSFVLLLFVFIGGAIHTNYNNRTNFIKGEFLVATILERPQEKANSYKSMLGINAVKCDTSLLTTKEKVLVYFEKTDKVKNLFPGTQILLKSTPTEINNFGTPYSFDYKAYLKNKRIYRQVYLSTENWKATNIESKSLLISAEQLREKLLTIYRSHNLGHNETEILSALTLGYKRDLEPETKRIFSAAGAMHILAVSGLHVGIIYILITFILGYLRKQKAGKVIFVIAAILLLWVYAFITGLSPSVLRASTMFSILIIGDNIQRKANIYNSLAASALFLLLLNPNNLFEVGFQLSYCAVFGIVFLQAKFAGLWPVKNRILKFFWNLFCVSVAAQIVTFPLSAFYFNQFPVYFGITNLIVIPAAMALIPLGIALLAFSKVPFVSVSIAFCIKGIIKWVYAALQWIEHLPYSVVDFSIYSAELVCLIGFLFFSFLFIKSKQAVSFKLSLLSLFLLVLSTLALNYRQHKSHELIVFNNAANISMQLISGRTNYVISKQEIEADDFLLRQIQEINRKKRLLPSIFLTANDVFEDDFLFLNKGLLCFEGKTILLENKHKNQAHDFSPNYYITSRNFRFKQIPFNEQTKLISNGYTHANTTNRTIYFLKTAGAFSDSW